MNNQPFYADLAAGLADIIDDTQSTACTNGEEIRWSSKFVATLTDEELRFVLLHEAAGHCGLGHLWHFPNPDEALTQALDHAINLSLQSIAGIRMPNGGLADPRFAGMAEIEIAAVLRKEAKQNGGKNSEPDTCGGYTAPKPSATDAPTKTATDTLSEIRENWERRIIMADQTAKLLKRGDTPGDIAAHLERMRAYAVDFRAETLEFLRTTIATMPDWSRAARRHASAPVIYPRRKADGIGVPVFARDTSGSVSAAEQATFAALIDDAMQQLGINRAIVLDCDATIKASHELNAGDECPRVARGGGGTDFRPVFAHVADLQEQGEQIAGVVYLTDMWGRFPAEDPAVPVLWLATTKATAPFGRTVKLR
jgi:predicted metal-dependent peptidase